MRIPKNFEGITVKKGSSLFCCVEEGVSPSLEICGVREDPLVGRGKDGTTFMIRNDTDATACGQPCCID